VLAPAAGVWTARVLGTDVPQGPQAYSLVGFDTRPPADPTSAVATAVDDTTIALTWLRPEDVDRAGTLVVRSTTPVAWTPADGTSYVPGTEAAPGVDVVAADDADHSGTPLLDAVLSPGVTYHYAFFAYDEVPNYSPGVADTATTTTVLVAAPSVPADATGVPRFVATGRNPSRGRVDLRLELPRSAFVRLEVYDVTGRRVATLVQGEKTGGSYAVAWDGREADGRAAAGGIYFVRLRAGDSTQTRKVVLVR
jgi:FlgD Ig-like domain